MKNILVLGATGTVASPLTRLLVDAGHAVKAATRSPGAYEGPGEPVAFDLADASTWDAALEGVERVFVLAPPGFADQHAALSPFLERVFASARVDRIVTMTAQGVEFDDAIPFRRLELAIEASGKPFVHLRPTWFSQNFHTFWGHGVREHDVIALPAADARVPFVDARDIAASAAAALTRDDVELGRAYEPTGPASLTHAEAAAALSEVLGRTITYTPITDDAFRAQLAPSGLPADYIELLVGLFQAMRASEPRRTDDVEALTGRAPLDLKTYARDHAAALS
jgi:uncharacterized protein YbjT (DUF2867 family)